MLCKEYGLNPTADGVIISHKEGHKRGIASNHGDPEHLWKQLGMGYTMDGFRQDVKSAMGKAEESKEENTEVEKWYRVRKTWADAKSQKGAYKKIAYAKACADKNDGYSVFDWDGNVVYPAVVQEEPKQEQTKVSYRVRVEIKNLNIRKGPGTNYAKTGKYTGVGVFTIVAESDGQGAGKWGKLKSGAGWISLDYCKKL